MITEYTKCGITDILYVINDAALKYKGIIPDDCWYEPYMAESKLVNEFTDLDGLISLFVPYSDM